MRLEHYVRISSANPARAFGMWPDKGQIGVGALADIAAVDVARQVITSGRLHSRAKITPFEGKTIGAPLHTIVRGKFVQRDRQLVQGMAGHGRQGPTFKKCPQQIPRTWTRVLPVSLRKGEQDDR